MASTGYGYPSGSVVDGGAFDGTVSIGASFDDDRGHAVAYFGYRKVKPVPQGRRDYQRLRSAERSAMPLRRALVRTRAAAARRPPTRAMR